MQSVTVSLRSWQNWLMNSSSDEDELYGMHAQGVIWWEDDTFVLYYLDAEQSQLNSATTTIRISPTMTTIRREGKINSFMPLELGKKHDCYYQTVFGSIKIGVNATKLDYEIEENGDGSLRASYIVDMNDIAQTKNRLSLEWETSPTLEDPESLLNFLDRDRREQSFSEVISNRKV